MFLYVAMLVQNIQNATKLEVKGEVGFYSLPDQTVNKAVKRGFDLNIMCAGMYLLNVHSEYLDIHVSATFPFWTFYDVQTRRDRMRQINFDGHPLLNKFS